MSRAGQGLVGTAMGGPSSSRKWALKKNLPCLIKARDLLTAVERKIIDDDEKLVEICTFATEAPSVLRGKQICFINGRWLELARAGKLHGIRNKQDVKVE